MHFVESTSHTRPLKAFITGVSGFVGSHLVNFLYAQGWQVYGFDRHRSSLNGEFYVGDIQDRDALTKALVEVRPDVIFHLAGVLKSGQPEEYFLVNVLGTIALLDAILNAGIKPTVLITSSSAVYGLSRGHLSEGRKPRPITHYGVSKLAQEAAALRYFDAFQLPVIVVRMFNLLGPGQSPDLACSAFAHQIARAELRGEDEIVTGDLNTRRDFVDVRDAVRALAFVAEKGKAGQSYNVCSGHGVLIRKCLDEMLSMSPQQFKITIHEERLQKNDVPDQIGDPRKLKQVIGWKPQVSLKRSLSDLLEYWRHRVKSELE